MKYRVFVKWEPIPLEKLKQDRLYRAVEAADNGALTMLKSYVSSTGFFQTGGYEFDVREYFRRYVVNFKNYGWSTYYAFNKTCIRNVLGSHQVLEIVEAPLKRA
jgi:hypothetical protein